MDIVYRITFNERLKNNTPPYYYIGSKTNCDFIDNKIIDDRGKPYYGSSSINNYKELVESDYITVEILYEEVTNNYETLLCEERKYQIENDVVASVYYFNKAIAAESNYCDPNYATYKHIETNKTVRLRRDHPMVISGEYVGVSKGNKLSDLTKAKISIAQRGEKNGFYGKKHTDEVMKYMYDINIGRKHTEETRKSMSLAQKGKPKKYPMTDEHKKNLSGFIVLKNILTKKTIKIKKELKESYDSSIWMNPYAYKMKFERTQITCPHCKLSKLDSNKFRYKHFNNCKDRKENENKIN